MPADGRRDLTRCLKDKGITSSEFYTQKRKPSTVCSQYMVQCEVQGSHGVDDTDHCLRRCDAV